LPTFAKRPPAANSLPLTCLPFVFPFFFPSSSTHNHWPKVFTVQWKLFSKSCLLETAFKRPTGQEEEEEEEEEAPRAKQEQNWLAKLQ